MKRLKVLTVVGTRPEIIRLSRVIARLDELCDHVLVHTGQNYDYELNQVFFDDLEIRKPTTFSKAPEARPLRRSGTSSSGWTACSSGHDLKRCSSWATPTAAWL